MNPHRNDKRKSALWECCNTPSNQRPGGLAPKPGCGLWNVLRTHLTEGDRKHRMMGLCSCNKKRSLNAGKVHFYDDHEKAIAERDRRNGNVE